MIILQKNAPEAFEKAGYDRTYGKVTLSTVRISANTSVVTERWQEQKAYKKAPFMIAEDVVALLEDSVCMEEVEVVKPGFINIRLKKSFVADYLRSDGKRRIISESKDRTSGDDH
ncbi:MAG: hypothetical protein ACLR2O_06285 [Coprococcus sp.]